MLNRDLVEEAHTTHANIGLSENKIDSLDHLIVRVPYFWFNYIGT